MTWAQSRGERFWAFRLLGHFGSRRGTGVAADRVRVDGGGDSFTGRLLAHPVVCQTWGIKRAPRPALPS